MDPNFADQSECGVLVASINGRDEILRLLVNAGADVNKKGKRGGTTAWFLALDGNAPALKNLIAAGADLNARNDDGFPPLMAAALNGHVEVIKLLIQCGAAVEVRANERDWQEVSALDVAAMRGHAEVVKTLLDAGVDVNGKNSLGQTAVLGAVVANQVASVEALLAAGADLPRYGPHGAFIQLVLERARPGMPAGIADALAAWFREHDLSAVDRVKLRVLDKMERSDMWGGKALSVDTLRNHCQGIETFSEKALELALEQLIAAGLVLVGEGGGKQKGPFSLNPAMKGAIQEELTSVFPPRSWLTSSRSSAAGT